MKTFLIRRAWASWACLCLCFTNVQAQIETLTNADVIELTKLGFGEEVIIEKIQQSEHDFDTGLSGLKKLKEAGVSDGVIKAMVGAQSAAAKEKEKEREQEQGDDPYDPSAPHEPGIYCWMKKNGKAQLMQLEPTVYSQGKTGGWLESQLTYGLAKTKVKAVVPRPKARLRAPGSRPVFYFYFEQKSSGLSYSSSFINGATSPNEFVLVKMKATRNGREVTIAEANVLSSSKGTSSAETRDFDFEKIKPGIYKVTITTPLELGEYCFFYAGGTAERLFDFGVDPPMPEQAMSAEDEPKPRRASTKAKTVKAEEETWLDEDSGAAKAEEEEEPLTAEIVALKKSHLMIDLGRGNILPPDAEVLISLPRKAGVPARVVESEGHNAILKVRDPKALAAFAVGDQVIVKRAE